MKAQGSTEDKKMVDRWVGDLLKRYDDLNFTLDEKNVRNYHVVQCSERLNQRSLLRAKLAIKGNSCSYNFVLGD